MVLVDLVGVDLVGVALVENFNRLVYNVEQLSINKEV